MMRLGRLYLSARRRLLSSVLRRGAPTTVGGDRRLTGLVAASRSTAIVATARVSGVVVPVTRTTSVVETILP